MIVDRHVHLLPGVDDGPSCMDDAVAMLEYEASLGVQKVYATYHFKPGIWECSPSSIKKKLQELVNSRVNSKPAHIELICELWLDDSILATLENEGIVLADSNVLLLELPYLSAAILLNSVFLLVTRGYKPVICHPERYLERSDDIIVLEDAKRMGAKIQVDASAPAGLDGLSAKKWSILLLDAGIVDYVASDAHSPNDSRLNAFRQAIKNYPHLVAGEGFD